MSEENVRRVAALQPPAEADLTKLFRDEGEWARLARIFEPRVHEDIESGFVRGGERTSYRGLAGFRQTWLDWLEPWDSYRVEIRKLLPHGGHVVVLVHDYGRRTGMTAEVRLRGAAVWTVRDGKISRAFFYTDREDALDDVGLSRAILARE
jgi:ketosteroid isomerase-like protein